MATTANVESTQTGYHRVQYGAAEVTVRPDGMITLPQLVPPEEIQDLAGALISAQPIGERQQADNEEAQVAAESFFAKQQAEAQATVDAARNRMDAEQRRMAKARGARRPVASAAAPRRKSGGPRGAARAATPAEAQPPPAPAKKATAAKQAAKKPPVKRAAHQRQAAADE